MLDHAENELWKQPPDPVLEAVAKIVSADNREWEGSPTELAQAIQTDMAVNRLTKHLNVNASRLLEEHQVRYENKTKHAGRRIRLTYMMVEAPAFEVIEQSATVATVATVLGVPLKTPSRPLPPSRERKTGVVFCHPSFLGYAVSR